MKSKLTLYILLLLSSLSYSQSQIAGKVLDENQEPMQFATVIVYPKIDSLALIGDLTSTDGTFIIKGLKNEKYILTVQMLGYEDHTQEITVDGYINIVPVQLKIQATTLDAVEIVAHQSTIESHLGKKVLRIGNDLTSTGSNALEAIA